MHPVMLPLPSSEKVLLGHTTQVLDELAPITVENLPATQSVHSLDVAPIVAEKLPA